jgi:hypothetical protein
MLGIEVVTLLVVHARGADTIAQVRTGRVGARSHYFAARAMLTVPHTRLLALALLPMVNAFTACPYERCCTQDRLYPLTAAAWLYFLLAVLLTVPSVPDSTSDWIKRFVIALSFFWMAGGCLVRQRRCVAQLPTCSVAAGQVSSLNGNTLATHTAQVSMMMTQSSLLLPYIRDPNPKVCAWVGYPQSASGFWPAHFELISTSTRC